MPVSSLTVSAPFPLGARSVFSAGSSTGSALAMPTLEGAAQPTPASRTTPPITDSVQLQSAPSTERVRLSDRLNAVVDARLMLLPSPAAAAVALCAAVRPDATGTEPTTRAALEAVRSLSDEVAADALTQVTLRDEIEESRAFAEGFLMASDDAPAQVAIGQAVLERLERATPASLQCRVHVLDGGGHTAFGKGGEGIFLSSDMLELPPDELAATLAHERTHLLERHLPLTQVMRRVGRALEAQASDAARPSVRRVNLLAQAEQRRAQEYEADARGTEMLVAAGYDRSAMTRLLARNAPETQPPSLLDEYPTTQARIAALS